MTAVRVRLQADGEPPVLLVDLAAECAALLAEHQIILNGQWGSGEVRFTFGPNTVDLEFSARLSSRRRATCRKSA